MFQIIADAPYRSVFVAYRQREQFCYQGFKTSFNLAESSDEAVTKLVAAIKPKTPENLTLSETNMKSAAAEVLKNAKD